MARPFGKKALGRNGLKSELSPIQLSQITSSRYRMAPEYLKGKSQYNASCDIYSFGEDE